MSWSFLIGLVVVGLVLGVISLIVWWLLIASEGVYLGRRVVVGLYDVYARQYDSIKKYRVDWESSALAEPFLALLGAEAHSPLILDVATGTGRLPAALHAEPGFYGRVIGMDASAGMLRQAAFKTPITVSPLIQSDAGHLPFADAQFDAVTCLEALEFFPDMETALRECIRVLRPGGLLFVTNRKGTRMMPGRVRSTRWMIDQLADKYGLCGVEWEIWQVDYDQVWGWKPGPAASNADVSSGPSNRSSVGWTPQ